MSELADDLRAKLDERVLPDDYPVYGDYFYVADGEPIRSDIFGDVRRLKHMLGAKEIRRCDIEGRRAIAKAESSRNG
jgi:hypothetical protein